MRKYSLSSFFLFTKYVYTIFILKLWKKSIGLLLHIIIINCQFNRDLKMVTLLLLFFQIRKSLPRFSV
nr:unnamed protein product [Callosobruchus analis]